MSEQLDAARIKSNTRSYRANGLRMTVSDFSKLANAIEFLAEAQVAHSRMLADWRIEDMELARRRQTVEDEQLAAIADMRTFVARSTVVLDGLAMRLTAIEHHIGLDPTLPAEGTTPT